MKNHWNYHQEEAVTGGFPRESRDSKPPMYLPLGLEDKDGHQSAPPRKAREGSDQLAPGIPCPEGRRQQTGGGRGSRPVREQEPVPAELDGGQTPEPLEDLPSMKTRRAPRRPASGCWGLPASPSRPWSPASRKPWP